MLGPELLGSLATSFLRCSEQVLLRQMIPDHQSGSRDGRVVPTPCGEPPEQQKSTPCAETDDVTQGEPAKSLPGCNTAMGQRMVHFSEYFGRVEEIYLPEDGPSELGANIAIAEAEWAEQEARKADFQPGLVLWTDGSRDENGPAGYAVAWREGRSWAGRKTHMGYYQEAYDAECAAIARALEVAAERAKRRRLGRVRIFTDAQAAITRMTHDEPGLRPDLRPTGEEGDRSLARAGSCHRDRDPLVPSTQGHSRQRDCGRLG